ncbi:MAG: exodeoxyribonuclease VII small subunit [Actinomycetaceae bacterium]|nr:exodeoxyribonuclease VII small subunit [Actinomycetaceae bacterium]
MTDDQKTQVAASELSYEQARDELVTIVRQLESGSTPLEETLSLWERGEELARRCQQILNQAQARIEKATQDAATPE